MALLLVRPKELRSIEMDHVPRVLGDPDFRLPCDFRSMGPEIRTSQEGCNIHSRRRTIGEHVFQFQVPFSIDRAVGSHSLNQEQPALVVVVEDDVWEFVMLRDVDIEAG